jgi:uncharacterized BrkB/YihY/UPF0761 family membrane protein
VAGAEDSEPDVEPVAPKRFATSRERVKSGISAGRERIDRARETSTSVAVAFDAIAHDGEAGGTVLAAALGFRVFLFQIPYFCFLVILASYVADLFNKSASDVFQAHGIGGLTANGMANAANLSGGARLTATLVASYALFLSARSYVKVLRVVHVLVWRVPLKKMVKPTRATLSFIGIVTASFVLSVGISALRDRFIIGEIVGLILYTLVPFLVWLIVSWWLPHRPCQIWALGPGALLFALGVQALHIVTVVWLPYELENKSQVYGALGLALVLLLWAYLLGRLMTLSIVLNYSLWERRERETPGASLRPLRLPFVDDHIGIVLERFFPLRTEDPAHNSSAGVSGSRRGEPY